MKWSALRACRNPASGGPLLALVGTGLAMVGRNQSGTIGSALGWLLLIEPLVSTAAPEAAKWLPFASGLALMTAWLEGTSGRSSHQVDAAFHRLRSHALQPDVP